MMGIDITLVVEPYIHWHVYFWVNYQGSQYEWWVDLDQSDLHLIPQCEEMACQAFQRLKERLATPNA